jgi:hypothetical protein
MYSKLLILRGSIWAHGRILGTRMHKTLPEAQIHPRTTHHSALVPHGTHKYLPLPGNGLGTIMAGTWALLCGGELDGTRILRQDTVDAAFTNQIGDLDFPSELPTADPASTCVFNAGPGYKWGHGLLLNTVDIPGMRRAWSGAWAGLCNTQFWVDRTAGVCGSIYSNFLPFVTPEAVKLYNDFERSLYAAL